MFSVSIQPETLFSIGSVSITNTFLTSILVSFLLMLFSGLFFFLSVRNESLMFSALRVIVYELLKLTDAVTENRELSKKILPLIVTFFLFIGMANILELVPGFLGSFFLESASGRMPLLRSPDSDLTTTIALALFSVGAMQYFSIHALGVSGYFRRFLNFSNPIRFILGFFEMLSEGVRILSFSFRLFGNVLAGEILLLIVGFVVPFFVPLPFMILEVFVGIVQAFIFTVLTLTFIRTGTMREVESA